MKGKLKFLITKKYGADAISKINEGLFGDCYIKLAINGLNYEILHMYNDKISFNKVRTSDNETSAYSDAMQTIMSDHKFYAVWVQNDESFDTYAMRWIDELYSIAMTPIKEILLKMVGQKFITKIEADPLAYINLGNYLSHTNCQIETQWDRSALISQYAKSLLG